MNASNIKAEVSAKEPWPRTLEKEVELSMGVVCTLNASIFNNGLQYHGALLTTIESTFFPLAQGSCWMNFWYTLPFCMSLMQSSAGNCAITIL